MKTKEKLYLDIHVLQSVPPNDSTIILPKTTIYGGVNRAWVSSQGWERVVRDMFSETMLEDNVEKRTKLVVDIIEMAKGEPSLNIDACVQLAHSISTHQDNYSKAVDDLSPEDNTGTGNIGNTDFSSATLYRYANVAVHELYRHLGEETAGAVKAFLKTFVFSMPTGKQNTFPDPFLPDAVLVTLRKDQPINFVGAFKRPVDAGKNNSEGYVIPSAQALVNHVNNMHESWLELPIMSLVAGELLKDLGKAEFFETLLGIVEKEIQQLLA